MSNLTSTVPGAFNALYNLLVAAGDAQNPTIPVFHSEVLLGVDVNNGYVLLEKVENQRIDLAALGSYAQYETYDICGTVTYQLGGPDPTTMAEDVLNGTWSIYQNVVMSTVVANRGGNGVPILGSQAPTALQWILPDRAEYTGGAASGDVGGFVGVIEFVCSLKARLTVT